MKRYYVRDEKGIKLTLEVSSKVIGYSHVLASDEICHYMRYTICHPRDVGSRRDGREVLSRQIWIRVKPEEVAAVTEFIRLIETLYTPKRVGEILESIRVYKTGLVRAAARLGLHLDQFSV